MANRIISNRQTGKAMDSVARVLNERMKETGTHSRGSGAEVRHRAQDHRSDGECALQDAALREHDKHSRRGGAQVHHDHMEGRRR